ncbi:hypothetical protein ACEV74_22345 [Vibrio parahaemolyticus]
MFGFGKKKKIDRVFSLLNQDVHFSSVKAENIFERQYISGLYELSSDVDTTVTLALLEHQSVFAQRMETQAPYDDIVEEFIALAAEKDTDAKSLIEQEGERYIESAKFYGNSIADKLDNGRIVSSAAIREFCANHAEVMLASWIKYRLNLLSAFARLSEN